MDNTIKEERDIKALNMVFRDYEKFFGDKVRFYIKILPIDGEENLVVWDTELNEICYIFGDVTYYSKLMTKYAELPCNFSLKN